MLTQRSADGWNVKALTMRTTKDNTIIVEVTEGNGFNERDQPRIAIEVSKEDFQRVVTKLLTPNG